MGSLIHCNKNYSPNQGEEVIIGQSLSNILVHVVFSTKNRQGWIQAAIEPYLYRFMSQICVKQESILLQVGGVSDHVHLLINLSRNQTLSQLVAEIKTGSSRWIKREYAQCHDFAWQSGYGAFSIGQPHVKPAISYIARQKEHHKVMSFQDEFRMFLKKYQIPWDERYVWD